MFFTTELLHSIKLDTSESTGQSLADPRGIAIGVCMLVYFEIYVDSRDTCVAMY